MSVVTTEVCGEGEGRVFKDGMQSCRHIQYINANLIIYLSYNYNLKVI
jgi:hypothetical protein